MPMSSKIQHYECLNYLALTSPHRLTKYRHRVRHQICLPYFALIQPCFAMLHSKDADIDADINGIHLTPDHAPDSCHDGQPSIDVLKK